MYFKVHLSQVSNLTHDFKLAPDFKTMAENSKLWPRIQNYYTHSVRGILFIGIQAKIQTRVFISKESILLKVHLTALECVGDEHMALLDVRYDDMTV